MQNPKTKGVQPLFQDRQIAKAIYLRHMSALKEVLNLGEMKFGTRESPAYKTYKKIVMDAFYNAMSEVFAALEKEGAVQKCPCGTSIRQGYQTCPKCNGAGHCNTDSFDAAMEQVDPVKDAPPEDKEIDEENFNR